MGRFARKQRRRQRAARADKERGILMKITLTKGNLLHLYGFVLMQQKLKSETEQDLIADFQERAGIEAGTDLQIPKDDSPEVVEIETDLQTVKLIRRLIKAQMEVGIASHVSNQFRCIRETLDAAVTEAERVAKEAKDPKPEVPTQN